MSDKLPLAVASVALQEAAAEIRQDRVDDDDDDGESSDGGNSNNSITSLTRFPLSSQRHSLALDQLLFFMAGLGSSLGYISSLSSLVYFQQSFGNDFFVSLNLAVYIPLVPIAVAQALWDQQYDQFYATRQTFVVRAIVAYSLIILGTMGMILIFFDVAVAENSVKARNVIFASFLQGTGGAILYGQLNQLASFMTKNGFDGGGGNTAATSNVAAGQTDGDHEDTSSMTRKFKATVSAGVQASALVVLLLSWTSGFGTMNAARYVPFLWSIVLVTILCFGCLLWLLLANQRVQASMIHRDSSIQRIPSQLLRIQSSSDSQDSTGQPGNNGMTSRLEQPLLPVRQQQPALPAPNSSTSLLPSSLSFPIQPQPIETIATESIQVRPASDCYDNLPEESSSLPPLELSVADLWAYTRSCCTILAMTLVPSFLVGSWFTHIKTTTWMELPQILFYVRIGMDFLGRLATLGVQGQEQQGSSNGSLKCVVWTALFRWGIVALFFFNASVKLGALEGFYQDALSVGLVAIIAFLSGYLVTSCYQLAPLQLPEDFRVANATKQASFLTVAFAVSAFAGLLSSFALTLLGV